MKPILLSMKAFGPFSQEQVVDFTPLHNRSLFLIHGPTGAGKTSILDALCYALYGQTSVTDRSIATIRSHHADPSIQTEITLIFAIGTATYRVLRIPEQDRPKSRGEGLTRKTASALLEQQIIDNGNLQWKIISDRWNRVTEKIESILGFRCDQFRQVVILPQGEFRKLLNASSQERQAILATLFKTGWYHQIEDALKIKAREIKTTFDALKSQVDFILADCECDTPQMLSDKIPSVLEECSRLESIVSELRIRETGMQEQLAIAKRIILKFDEYESAHKEFFSLDLQREQFRKLESETERTQKALNLSNSHEHLKKLRSEYETLTYKHLQSQTSLTAANTQYSKYEELNKKIPTLEKQSEQLKFHFEYVKSLLPKVQELSVLSEKFLKHFTSHDECNKQLVQSREHLEKVKSALNKLREQEAHLRQDSSQLESLSNQLTSLQQLCSVEKRKNEISIQILATGEKLKQARENYEQVTADLQTIQNDIERFEHLIYEGRAALLAVTLKDNTPCPVCGSLTHPQPAQSDLLLPDENHVKELKIDLKKKDALGVQKRESIDLIERNLNNLQKEYDLLIEQLGIQDGQGTTLDTQRKECALSVQKAEEASKKLKNTQENITRGESALITAESSVNQLMSVFTESISLLSSAETLFRTAEQEIPLAMRNLESISDEATKAEKQILTINSEILTLRTQFETAVKHVASSQAYCDSLGQQVVDLEKDFSQLSRQFTEEIVSMGFSDENDYIETLRGSTHLSDNKKKIQSFSLALHAALDRKNRAGKECENLTKIDLTTIEKYIADIQTEIVTVVARHASKSNQYNQLTNRMHDCETLNKKMGQCEADYAIAGHLANVSSGENPLRITFERFILATLLDDVLYAGSQRLTVMSRNRYTLHRARTHNDQRTAGGLDLMVFDSYTGTSRPANSLSGGESFLAALSLALGLADVVQSYSGGIHLDTLFIDEGFGSLDSEALDCAFQALTELGRNGRLVGIISHVSELKERIDTRIEITSGKSGSSVHVRI